MHVIQMTERKTSIHSQQCVQLAGSLRFYSMAGFCVSITESLHDQKALRIKMRIDYTYLAADTGHHIIDRLTLYKMMNFRTLYHVYRITATCLVINGHLPAICTTRIIYSFFENMITQTDHHLSP